MCLLLKTKKQNEEKYNDTRHEKVLQNQTTTRITYAVIFAIT